MNEFMIVMKAKKVIVANDDLQIEKTHCSHGYYKGCPYFIGAFDACKH